MNWRIPASVFVLVLCLFVWHDHGFLPALLIAGIYAVVSRLDAIVKRLDETGRPKGWYPADSGDEERYWNGRAWADLPPRPIKR